MLPFGTHLPTPVMAGTDPPSPCLKAALCLSEIPRQARDDRGSRMTEASLNSDGN